MIVVEVDPTVFDGPDMLQLLGRLDKHFMMPVTVTTPDWEAEDGIRSMGAFCPNFVLTSQEWQWRDLELPPDPDDLPF